MKGKELWKSLCMKKIYQFTLDFEKWFWEGQYVNVTTKNGILNNARIGIVNSKNCIQFIKNEHTVMYSYEDIINIEYVYKRASDTKEHYNNNSNIFAIRTIPMISLDFENWFLAGQTVNFNDGVKDYKNALIKNITDYSGPINKNIMKFVLEDGSESEIQICKIEEISHVERRARFA